MEFIKTNKQQEAVQVLSSHRYTALFGGSRSGKTAIIVYSIIVRAAKIKSRHAIIRNTFNSVKRAIFLDTMPKILKLAFPNLLVKWNKSDFYISLPNGSEIWFFGLDDKKTERILGMEFSTIFFDEASELEYKPIQMAITRLAEKNELVKRVFFAFNPPNKTHWSYYLFIKNLNPSENEPLEDKELYGSLLMNPKDNLENIDEEYLKILEKMPEEERKRFLLGEFTDQSDGQVYYEFNREKHVAATKRYPGTLFIGADFNVGSMAWIIFQVINNQIHVIDEIFLKNSDTPKTCFEVIKRGYRGARVIPDSTGRNRKTSGQSDFDIIKENGFIIESTFNPFVTDRVNNVNRLLKDNKIVIDPKCRKLINDLEKVVWKDNKLDQKTDPLLTHISDALGYACHKLMPFSKVDTTPYMRNR